MAKFALQSRLFWLFVLVAHALGAAAWMALMPRGFPFTHARFCANVAIPLAIVACVIAALVQARRGRLALTRSMLLALATMWIVASIVGRMIFPISLELRWLAPLLLGAAVALAANAAHLRPVRLPTYALALALLLGAGVGATLPWLQRAPMPSTHPLDDIAISAPPGDAPDLGDLPRTRHAGLALVTLGDGQLTASQDRYVVYVNPLLTFISRSPDRCWTSLAPRLDRLGPRRRLVQSDADGLLHYADDDASTLSVVGEGSRVAIVARSSLRAAVYSHLNTFCELQLAGHRKLSVSFSPCPQAKIDVMPSDYPVGRPARCAFFGADGIFRIVEASTGEKGPFRELASGPLAREQSLSMTFHDEGRPFCTVTLDDFAAQASTDLSPTAGWGLPMNAIEFSRDNDRETSPASVFVTLAGTSVGRGWDSVGHAAGTYRNRMTIEMQGHPSTKAETLPSSSESSLNGVAVSSRGTPRDLGVPEPFDSEIPRVATAPLGMTVRIPPSKGI
jgi:hypothetical protein